MKTNYTNFENRENKWGTGVQNIKTEERKTIFELACLECRGLNVWVSDKILPDDCGNPQENEFVGSLHSTERDLSIFWRVVEKLETKAKR